MTDLAAPENEHETATDDGVDEITEGPFEEELDVTAEDAGAFLVELGRQLQQEDELHINGNGWRLDFEFDEPVELEIELEGDEPAELEVEVELPGRVDEDEPPAVA
jgi:amphi-Trp domain-containing protein